MKPTSQGKKEIINSLNNDNNNNKNMNVNIFQSKVGPQKLMDEGDLSMMPLPPTDLKEFI